MIDVLLVLIIIFMLITPLAPKGLKTLVPEEPQSAQTPAPTTDIVVTVLPERAVRINQERVAISDLYARFVRIFGGTADRVLFIRAEGDLEFSQVAEVIDIAKGAGLTRVALMPGEHRESLR